MQIQPCAIEGAGAPQVRWVQGLDAADRDAARLQARMAMQSCLAAELGCTPDELGLTNIRGQAPQLLRNGLLVESLGCSISHASGQALLAWHWGGPVGADLQAVDCNASVSELLAVAKLYLNRKSLKVLIECSSSALFFENFTRAWVAHEARLKCVGIGLVEWSEAVDVQLSAIRCAPIPLDAYFKGAVAWK